MYYEMQYRVPYADTDQMGVVYYANYLEYFERSRTEMFRQIGMPYSQMEKEGFFMPVAERSASSMRDIHPVLSFFTERRWSTSESKPVRIKPASRTEKGGSSTMEAAISP